MGTANYWAVIPAAGTGTRMAMECPKQYLTIQNKCILEHTVERFCQHPKIKGIVIALAADDRYWPLLPISANEKVSTCAGGEERCHSVFNSLTFLQSLAAEDDWVLVHDAARPCLRADDIDKLLTETAQHPVGGILALPVSDTMKCATPSGDIEATLDREGLWHALTPQMFRLAQLRRALSDSLEKGRRVTDEAQAIEALGLKPKLIQGHADNIKVTLPSDVARAELFLAEQERAK